MKPTLLEVDRYALLYRIKRRLAAEGRQLKASRSIAAKAQGAYHVVQAGAGVVEFVKDDKALEKFARRVGALAEHEKIAD